MMKRFFRFAAVLCSMAMGLCAVSGCKSSTVSTASSNPSTTTATTAAAPVEITFWHSYSEGEQKIFNDQVLTAFENKYPNIKVKSVRMPYEGMDQQFVTAVTGDAAPDVMRMDITWVSQMAKLGALTEMDTLDGFDALKANSLASSLATNLYKGKYYGLPLDTNTTAAVFSNDTLKNLGFTAPPKTLDELMTAKSKTNPSKEKWLFAVQGSFNWAMLPFIWTLGGSLTDDSFTKATGYLNSDATVKALKTIHGWYKDKVIGPSVLGEQPDTAGGISGGNYSMIVEGPWFFSGKDAKEISKYTPALIPSVEGRSISIIGGEDVVIAKTSKHQEAAWTFTKFLLEDAQQLALSKAGQIPAMTSALSKVDTSATPYVQVYIDQLKTAKPRTPSANWPQIEKVLNQAFENVLRDKATEKDALDQAAAQIDKLLAE